MRNWNSTKHEEEDQLTTSLARNPRGVFPYKHHDTPSQNKVDLPHAFPSKRELTEFFPVTKYSPGSVGNANSR